MTQQTKMIEEDLAIRLPNHGILSTPVTLEAVVFYASESEKIKKKIDHLAAEVSQKQDRIKFVNEIIQEINNAIDPTTGKVDLRNKAEFLEKLNTAKGMGINIPMDSKTEHPKAHFNAEERERFLQNLGLSADAWDKENKQHTQKMQMYLDESNRYLTLATQAMKYEDKPKRAALAAMGR
ncbi:hypothetical protein [Candidatus Protochlamydia sp. W-9]|uniref:hypothetical protein n=1 Tax=Candidatus Protochlamydia sp. W-9 TaxID=1785087 RepID=UPI00096AB706|nr:hypothetical protein [Candidatus Protochlamydia sp. W-9]